MTKSEKQEILNLPNSRINKAVIIQGTDFDRKRKLSVKDVEKLKAEFAAGKSIKELSEKYGVTTASIKWHTDANYRELDKKRHRDYYAMYGRIDATDTVELASYKRSLIETGKIKEVRVGV